MYFDVPETIFACHGNSGNGHCGKNKPYCAYNNCVECTQNNHCNGNNVCYDNGTIKKCLQPGNVPKLNISVSPTVVNYGSAATISWTTSGRISSCSGSWRGALPLNGSASTGNLTDSRSFTITCSGSEGTLSKTVTVTVKPPPPPFCVREPAQIMLVLDTSNSMKGGKLARAKEAALTLVNILQQNYNKNLSNPWARGFWYTGDAVGLTSFDWDVGWDQKPVGLTHVMQGTEGYQIVREAIQGLKITDEQDNGTCLECALIETEREFKDPYSQNYYWYNNQQRPYKRYVVILSDGNANWWYRPNEKTVQGVGLQKGRDQARGVAQRMHDQMGVDFFTIHFGSDDKGTNYMQNLANDFGGSLGKYYREPNGNTLNTIFTDIANTIAGGSIGGITYYDIAGNGSYQSGTDPTRSNQEVSLYHTTGQFITQTYSGYDGKYAFSGICTGQFNIRATPRSGETVTQPSGGQYSNITISTTTNRTDLNFGFRAVNNIIGSITGRVFLDKDEDGRYTPGTDTNYTGPTLQFETNIGRNPTISSGGVFSFSNIPVGSYSIRLLRPEGYSFTFANNFQVGLSSSGTCSLSPNNGQMTCSNSNLSNLNIGLTDALPWVQTVGVSVRNDLNGFRYQIPTTTNQCQPYMIRNGTVGAGIVYTGTGTANFSPGSASSQNWIVNGKGTEYGLGIMNMSFENALTRVKNNKVEPKELANICTVSTTCTISNAALQNQPYLHGGDLTLGAVSITDTTKKAVIFVGGDLTITNTIRVPQGAFLMFIVKGNIHVRSGVGGGTTRTCAGTTPTPQLQAIFVTDRNFIAEGGTNCPTGDQQLNIAGSIVTNASREHDGKLINDRSLCAANKQYPAITIQPRLDFILNAPEYLLQTGQVLWEEVAP